MALATYSDVGIAIGRTLSSSAEIAQVSYWLDGIELLIKARVGNLSDVDSLALQYVETEAVAAKVRRNGQAESSITVSVDDGSVTRRYDPISASDITDEWWNLLTPADDRASASVRPGFAADTDRWPVSTPPWPYGGSMWERL